MKTIFSSNRKHMRRRPYFVRVYEQNGNMRYVVHGSPEERARYERYHGEHLVATGKTYKRLYRINVRPHP